MDKLPFNLKDGDRVRIVLEGPIVSISNDQWGREFWLGDDEHSNRINLTNSHVVSVEVLSPNIPANAIGQCLVDAVYRYDNRWWHFDNHLGCNHEVKIIGTALEDRG